jgi:hypothetical protein
MSANDSRAAGNEDQNDAEENRLPDETTDAL